MHFYAHAENSAGKFQFFVEVRNSHLARNVYLFISLFSYLTSGQISVKKTSTNLENDNKNSFCTCFNKGHRMWRFSGLCSPLYEIFLHFCLIQTKTVILPKLWILWVWGERTFNTTNLLRGSCYIAMEHDDMVHISNQNVWLTRRSKKQLVVEYSSTVCHVLFD